MDAIDRIKQIMAEAEISQTELADKSSLSFGTLNRILNRKQHLHPNTLQKIANGLGVSVAELDDNRESNFNNVVNGYLQFGDEITHITSFRALQNWIKKYEPYIIGLPKAAKQIFAEEKRNAKQIKASTISIDDIDFLKEEVYDAAEVECWSFRKAEDIRDDISIDLGNMCIAYHFTCCGRTFTNSEALYICGMFSDNTEQHRAIQEELLTAKSGYDAKKAVRRKYEREYARKDWATFNIEFMKWAVWQKIQGNSDFKKVLLSIPQHAHIIENSTLQKGETALFWGAKNTLLEEQRSIIEQWATYEHPTLNKRELAQKQMEERNKVNHIGEWQGVNCMGKILKYLQLCLIKNVAPNIDYELLRSKQIYLFGERLMFEQQPQQPTKQIVILWDMDNTLVDSSISKGLQWKEAQKLIPQYTLYYNIKDTLQRLSEMGVQQWIVSGNVESTIQKVVEHFNLPISNISGYKHGMTMDNLKRKIAVLSNAVKSLPTDAHIVYIGDEADDVEACRQMGIECITALWGNRDAEIANATITIQEPSEIFVKI